MKTKIQLHDVQAHILRGAKPAAAVYLALSIVERNAFLDFVEHLQPYVHSEARVREARMREHSRDLPSPFLINLGFSFTGLQKLGLPLPVLAQFPRSFQQGMAARASFIGDTGQDAPEYWQGKWGHPAVHVFLAIYYLSDQMPAAQRNPNLTPEEQLESLLATLKVSEPGKTGCVVLAKESAGVLRRNHRAIEHFGFKDGISQPYLQDGMDAPAGGGKKVAGNEGWKPLATGEFLLGYPDELKLLTRRDPGLAVDTPLPEPEQPEARDYFRLTRNGSFLVYRKIEQDVWGFRQHIVNKHGVGAAELMVGRRMDGAPLDAPNNGETPRLNNSFDFSHDRDGSVCPMGSHIRRTNPRTALHNSELHSSELQSSGLHNAGQNCTREVDQHRLIRRGMAYGPWLDENAQQHDGVERGLHFLCYNANLESQFEFVQKNWINSSDFFGCPAAMIDPLVGSVANAPLNPFMAPALDLPLMELPAVTRIRGGEYFFVPGLAGLNGIIELSLRAVRAGNGTVEMPGAENSPLTDPFDVARILGRAQLMSGQTYAMLPVTLADGGHCTFHYFAHPADVQHVMSHPEQFGNQHYRQRIDDLTQQEMLLSMPPSAQRTQLKQEMAALLNPAANEAAVLVAIRQALRSQLGQFAVQGHCDLVEGIARRLPLAIVKNYLGISAPAQFPSATEIAHYFDRSDADSLPPAWRHDYARYGLQPSADATLLFWIRMMFLEVFGNLWNVQHITDLARGAVKEFDLHLQQCVNHAFEGDGDTTVLERLTRYYQSQSDLTDAERKAQVKQRILEFVVGSTDTTMKAIATTVSVLLQKAPTLEMALFGILQAPDYAPFMPAVMAYLKGDTQQEKTVNGLLDGLIMNILKAYPVAPILVRDCEEDAHLTLANGQAIKIGAGSKVVAVLQGASLLSMLKPAATMPDFVFLDPWSPHGCMGKNIALIQVREAIKGLLTLKDVRAAAGAHGVMIEKYRLPAYQLLRCDGPKVPVF